MKQVRFSKFVKVRFVERYLTVDNVSKIEKRRSQLKK